MGFVVISTPFLSRIFAVTNRFDVLLLTTVQTKCSAQRDGVWRATPVSWATAWLAQIAGNENTGRSSNMRLLVISASPHGRGQILLSERGRTRVAEQGSKCS
jgi:hypothetical protein